MKFISAKPYNSGYGRPYLSQLVVELDTAEASRLLSGDALDDAINGRMRLGQEVTASTIFSDHDRYKKGTQALERILNALDDARSLIHPPEPEAEQLQG